jgi:short-subunit dehydrogenase
VSVGVGSKPRALVTGASRGIGRAVAEALVSEGYEVIGTCRNPRRLPAEGRLAGVRWLALDLANERSVARLAARVGAVDVLVNNAGMGQIGPAEEAGSRELRRVLEVDFFGPVRLAQLLTPAMRERRSGAIISIGSVRSEVPMPFFSAYSAAKAALRSWSDALRMELAPFGVRVTLLAPFDVRTSLPLAQAARDGSPYAKRLAFALENRGRQLATGADPRIVARAVVRLLRERRPPGFRTVGKRTGLTAVLLRHAPRRLVERIVRRTYDRG